jgi:hypothetical protein
MKKVKIYLILLFIINSIGGFSQAIAKTYDIVFEIRNFSLQKTIPLIQSYCNSFEGCKLTAYCEYQGWVVFTIDENYYSSSNDPLVLFKNATFDGIIKTGVTKSILENACKGRLVPINEYKKSIH